MGDGKSPKKGVGKVKKGENTKCNICKLNVSASQKGLQCDLCNDWNHIKCSNISDKAYDAYIEEKELPWVCKKCINDKGDKNIGINSINAIMKQLREDMKEMKNQMKENKTREKSERAELMSIIEEMREDKIREGKEKAELIEIIKGFKDQNKQIISKIDKVENYLEAKIEEENKKYKKEVETKVEKEIEEKMLRHDKKTNLIIYGIDENERIDEKESLKIDEGEIAKIFQDIEIDEEPTEFFRLGKQKRKDVERPILIKMKTERVCYEILRKSNQMRKTSEGKMKKITIRKDLTLRQREMNKKLTEELKQRREKGENNIKIKNGKIITLGEEDKPRGKNR